MNASASSKQPNKRRKSSSQPRVSRTSSSTARTATGHAANAEQHHTGNVPRTNRSTSSAATSHSAHTGRTARTGRTSVSSGSARSSHSVSVNTSTTLARTQSSKSAAKSAKNAKSSKSVKSVRNAKNAKSAKNAHTVNRTHTSKTGASSSSASGASRTSNATSASSARKSQASNTASRRRSWSLAQRMMKRNRDAQAKEQSNAHNQVQHHARTSRSASSQAVVTQTGQHRQVAQRQQAANTNTGRVTRVASNSSARSVSNANVQSVPHNTLAESTQSSAGAFVDARKLKSGTILEQTLAATSSRIGVATRPKVVDFSARLKERKKASARQIAMRVGIGAAIALVIGVVVWLLFFSSVMRLESSNISVSGQNEWVSESQIRKIADEQTGKSLLLVNGGAITTELKDIPGVSEAKVTKQFPNSLKVSVTAQRPTAMLKVKDSDAMTAVDSQGRILNSVEGSNVDGIPVIEVSNVNDALKNKAVTTAITVLSDIPEQVRAEITSVSADTQDSVTTVINESDTDYTVVWGNASQMKLKVAVVDKLIHSPDVLDGKTHIDVSAPKRPILK